jgi:Terminase small subunit
MPVLANPKHEAFCQARVSGKTQDEAYIEAGYSPNRSNARRLTTIEHIASRIRELEAKVADRFEITAELISKRLEEDREFARKCKVPSAAVQATVALGKLAGLFIEKSSVSVTHNYALMTEEELRFEMAALAAEARGLKPGVQH